MSNLSTSNVKSNEILKAIDINDSFDAQITNIAKTLQCLLETENDFIISKESFVIPHSDGNQDWTINLEPIFAISHYDGTPILETEITQAAASVLPASTFDRYDTVEIRGVYENTNIEQRSFIDFETNDKNLDTVYTRKELKLECRVLNNKVASVAAPAHTEGWIKVAEIFVPHNATKIADCTINNITSDISDMNNENWTNEKKATYNIHYISDVNERFRVEHNADGSHKNKIIHSEQVDFGVASNQVNNTKIPIGEDITVNKEGISSSESTLNAISKIVDHINHIYDLYLKNGDYNFGKEIVIYGDNSNTYPSGKKVRIGIKENNNVYIKIGTTEILNISDTGVISCVPNYKAVSENDVITKGTTDRLENDIDNLKIRISNLEETNDTTVYTNNVLARYSISPLTINVATTTNIVLKNEQTIDGIFCKAGTFILVKNQNDEKENGIYKVKSGVWDRDSINAPSKIKYLLFNIADGSSNKGKLFYCPTENFVNSSSFGTDNIKFSEYLGSIYPLKNKSVVRDSTGHVKSAVSVESDDCVTRSEIESGEMKTVILNYVYPVGSVYWSSNSTNPGKLFGGTWQQITDTFMLASGTKSVNPSKYSSEGGNSSVNILTNNLPAHTHGMSHVHSYTPEGTVDSHSHYYTPKANLPKHKHTFTPSGSISTDQEATFTGSPVTTSAMSSNGKFDWQMPSDTNNEEILYNQSSNMSVSRGSKATSIVAASWGYSHERTLVSLNLDHTHTITASGTINKDGKYTFSGKSDNTDSSGSATITFGDDLVTEDTQPSFTGSLGNTTSCNKTNTDSNTNGGQALNIMPPYLVRYCWERIS